MNIKVIFINLASVVSIFALIVCIMTPILVFTGGMEKDVYHIWFNWASLVWFIFAPFWFVPKIFGQKWKEAGNKAWLRPGGEE